MLPLDFPRSTPQGFPEFWSIWPRKSARIAAEKAWKAAVRKSPPNVIIASAKAYALSVIGTEAKYILHASTFLNQERWEDYQPKIENTEVKAEFDRWCCEWVNKGRNLAMRRNDADLFVRKMMAEGLIDREMAHKAGHL